MNRQYIGARYVPKFFDDGKGSSEWISGLSYEPLTVVTHLGNFLLVRSLFLLILKLLILITGLLLVTITNKLKNIDRKLLG